MVEFMKHFWVYGEGDKSGVNAGKILSSGRGALVAEPVGERFAIAIFSVNADPKQFIAFLCFRNEPGLGIGKELLDADVFYDRAALLNSAFALNSSIFGIRLRSH
jgi:hypothetical protein